MKTVSTKSGAGEAEARVTACRICGADDVTRVARFQPYLDYKTVVYDCASCGCRFTPHDPTAHERLHAQASSYDAHADYGRHTETLFAEKKADVLQAFLSRTTKFAFVINALKERPDRVRIAEIGCSRGFLLSLYILEGREAYGFDVSQTAVREATRAFGPHFHVISSDALHANAPYDVVYHTGTIGCVASPISFTRGLLSLLKPGGELIFNAPNREYVDRSRELWPDTPPPDLVTLFPSDFWRTRFAQDASVQVRSETCSLYQAWMLRRKRQRPDTPRGRMAGDAASPPPLSAGRRSPVRATGSRVVRAILERAPSFIPAPYGVFVRLTKA